MHLLVRIKQDAIDLAIFFFLTIPDILDLRLHIDLMLLDFLGHLFEEGVLAIHSLIEERLFQLGEPVIVAIKVVFNNDHGLAVLLRHVHDGLEEAAHHVTDLCFKVKPHQLISLRHLSLHPRFPIRRCQLLHQLLRFLLLGSHVLVLWISDHIRLAAWHVCIEGIFLGLGPIQLSSCRLGPIILRFARDLGVRILVARHELLDVFRHEL